MLQNIENHYETTQHRPQTSEWTSLNGDAARLLIFFGNEAQACLPSWHDWPSNSFGSSILKLCNMWD